MSNNSSYFLCTVIVLAILLSVLAGVTLLAPFTLSLAISLTFLYKQGFDLNSLLKMTWTGIWECRDLYIFILLIGANIAVWMASGVVPVLMFYGFELLKGLNFLLAAFLITALMSVFMGSAVGTISSLGIALLGIGQGFGIPAPVLLGTLVSGAYIADKISPISGLVNLTIKVTGSSYRPLLKRMAVTLVPVTLISSLLYLGLGQYYAGGEDFALVQQLQDSLTQGFRLSPWLALLPLGIVLLPLTGAKTITSIFLGMLSGALLTVFYQGHSPTAALAIILRGFQGATPSAELNALLVSGGVVGMLEVLLIVIAVIALSSLLERSGLLRPLIYQPLIRARSKGALLIRTGLIGSLLTIVTCDQATGIVLPARMAKEKYREMGLPETELARTISDTSTIIAPLLPWNVNAIIITLLTGIPAWQYGPYAFLCFLFPLAAGLAAASHGFTQPIKQSA